eukprot:jgi/Picre1/32656/NNA_008002.t1
MRRCVRRSLVVLLTCLTLVRCIEPITLIKAAMLIADIVETVADRCFLAEQCTCRNYHLLLQSKSNNDQSKTGPRFVFDTSEFALGTQCQLGKTPIFPGGTGGLVVGNGARTVFTGVTGWSRYLMYSDDGKHFLGCNAIFDFDNPYWTGITADRFANLRLDGPGCNNPPLRGKSDYQQRYDVVLNRIANIDEPAAKVLFEVYYENVSPTRDLNAEDEKRASLVLPMSEQPLCVNTTDVTWYDVTSSAGELNYLVGHTYMSGTEAGQAVRPSYDGDGCTVVSTDILQACVTATEAFGVPQAEYKYTAKAKYECDKGAALPEQTYTSVLYNEYQ